jgi:hypothetical protein
VRVIAQPIQFGPQNPPRIAHVFTAAIPTATDGPLMNAVSRLNAGHVKP